MHVAARDADGVPLVVAMLLSPGASPTTQSQAMDLMSALSADPPSQAAMVQAGGMAALLHILEQPLPRTQVCVMCCYLQSWYRSVPVRCVCKVKHGLWVHRVVWLHGTGLSRCENSFQISCSTIVLLDLQPVSHTYLVCVVLCPQVKETAVTTLHVLVRGIPDHLSHLCAQPRAQPCLQAALNAYGPSWYPCKADMHCLLNLMSKHVLQATAPDAVMVEMPEME